jgi:hypothetical protein
MKVLKIRRITIAEGRHFIQSVGCVCDPYLKENE